jgi:parallel beta-helix repeat protein
MSSIDINSSNIPLGSHTLDIYAIDGVGNTSNAIRINIIKPKVLNVKDYGARGDGNTDDTLAIWNAIQAARANGNGIIYFPRGVYFISHNHPELTYPLNPSDPIFKLRARNVTSAVPLNIVFLGDSPTQSILLKDYGSLFDTADVSNIAWKNLGFKWFPPDIDITVTYNNQTKTFHSYDAPRAIWFRGWRDTNPTVRMWAESRNIVIENCMYEGSLSPDPAYTYPYGDASPIACSWNCVVTDITVKNCIFRKTQMDGAEFIQPDKPDQNLYSPKAGNIYFLNNEIYDIGGANDIVGAGISIYVNIEGMQGIVRNNKFVGSPYKSVGIGWGGSNTIFEDNTILNCDTGMQLTRAENCIVRRNIIDLSGHPTVAGPIQHSGISLDGGKNIRIENNTVTGADRIGIRIVTNARVQFADNIIISSNNIYDNGKNTTLSGDQRAGIRIYTPDQTSYPITNIIITNNTVRNTLGTQVYGIYVTNTPSVSITSNTISGHRWRNLVVPNGAYVADNYLS